MAKWVEVEEEKQRTRELLRQKRLKGDGPAQPPAGGCHVQRLGGLGGAEHTADSWGTDEVGVQNGRPVAKKARWSVPLRGEGSFVVQFEIGPVGQQADATARQALYSGRW